MNTPLTNPPSTVSAAQVGGRSTRTVAVAVLIAFAIPIAIYAFAFQFLGAGDPVFHARFATFPLMAAFHVLGGGFALLAGGFQFSTRLRAAAPTLHRWLGRTYLLVVLLGGIGGAVLATMATGGLVARVGFFLLAMLWLWSGAAAYRAIRTGDVIRHRRWMMRNFALTFGAVMLRLEMGVLTGALGYSFADAYPLVAWLAWVPNLVLVEWFLLRRDAA